MLRRLKLTHRLVVLSCAVTLALLVMLFLTRLGGVANERLMERIEGGYFPALEISRDLEQALKDIRGGLEAAVAALDASQLREVDEVFRGVRSRLEEWAALTAADPGTISELEAGLAAYHGQARSVAERLIGGELGGEIVAAQRQANGAFEQLLGQLAQLTAERRAEMERAFETARTNDRRSVQVFGLITVMVLVAIVAVWGLFAVVQTTVTRPIEAAVELAVGLAGGNLTHRLRVDGSDEVSQMGRALNEGLERVGQTVDTIAASAANLARAADALTGVSRTMVDNASHTSTQAQDVSDATTRVDEHVQTVATNTDEMVAGVRDIAARAMAAAEVAEAAADDAQSINEVVSRLGQSSLEIGNVTRTISAIAEQTNLLALNATIEAARAGEMGKGFAVVAGEVKELARQTATATGEIGERISAIQGEIEVAVEGIGRFSGVVTEIRDIQASIASLVEEQTRTAAEISSHVVSAANGSRHITATASSVFDRARETSECASTTDGAAEELVRMAAELQRLVREFTY